MNREEFLTELQETLQREEPLTPDMKFSEIPEWDSLALLTVSALIHSEFNLVLSLDEVKELNIVEDLLMRLGL